MSSFNKNRSIDHRDNLVFLWINDRPPTYTDQVDLMEPILEMPVWSWHWKADGRIGAVVGKAGREAGISSDVYVYQLRWATEHYGAKNDLESISIALRNMREDFQSGKINIDHLDNNHRNCRIWNLTTMTRSQNARKQNFTAKIYEPFFWFSVNVGNSYRILCGDDLDNPRKLMCTKNEDYIELLRRFCEEEKITGSQRIGYTQTGDLDEIGEKMIQGLLTMSNEDFRYCQFRALRPMP